MRKIPNLYEDRLFEKYSRSLKVYDHYSQILFKFDQKEKSLDKAKEIIKSLGVKVFDIKTFDFPKDSIFFTLFKLSIADAREAVLALAEEDYTPIKGYNASLNG